MTDREPISLQWIAQQTSEVLAIQQRTSQNQVLFPDALALVTLSSRLRETAHPLTGPLEDEIMKASIPFREKSGPLGASIDRIAIMLVLQRSERIRQRELRAQAEELLGKPINTYEFNLGLQMLSEGGLIELKDRTYTTTEDGRIVALFSEDPFYSTLQALRSHSGVMGNPQV